MTGRTARDEILARAREALAGRAGPGAMAVPRDYRARTDPGVDVVALFAERVADYRATVHRATEADLPGVIEGVLVARGTRRVVAPAGVPAAWLTGGLPDGSEIEVVRDEPPLAHAEIEALDTVVTGCAAAIAETGTVILDGGAGQGRRVLSLLPDHHLCIVRESQVVGTVAEALVRLDPRRPLTWISGPSATSDIELRRVEGVHGPRVLDVVILAG